MVTAMGQQALVGQTLKSGAIDFVMKPFNKERILETINKSLLMKSKIRPTVRFASISAMLAGESSWIAHWVQALDLSPGAGRHECTAARISESEDESTWCSCMIR